MEIDVRKMLFGGTTRQLTYKSLDATALRGRVIAENLANIETPGYKRKEVSFEDQLQRIMDQKLSAAQTQNAHMPAGKGLDFSQVQPKVFEARDPTLQGEINNVDVDLEASKMAENTILYSFLTKWVGFDKFNAAIAGRSM